MLKVGTDFSGIGSPEQALKDLNIEHEVVFSCEIDVFAQRSYAAIHGSGNCYKDITTRNHSEVEQLGLYVAGFPCQAFSIAGKRKGFEDVRGTLFFNVADFIRVNKPECFILENVKGLLSHDKGRTFQTIIDLLSNGGGTVNGQMSLDIFEDGLGYHIYFQVLNTKEHGLPQNRERIFIVGFKDYRDFRFPLKEPLKLRIKDILEENVDEKYYLSDKMLKGFMKHNENHNEKGTGFIFSPKDGNDVANLLRANSALSATDNTVKVGYINQDTQASKVISDKGISSNICAGSHGYANGYIVHNLQPQTGDPKKGGTGHLSKDDGTAYCIDTGCSQGVEFKERIRRLTPLECWRLQGFSDEQFYKAQKVNSDTQLYKQAGNAISVNVIRKILTKVYPHR